MNSFNDICRVLKQKPPFVLVDRVLELEAGKRIVAIKNISGSEAFTGYHFPDNAIYPGIYIIECAAQTAALMFSLGEDSKNEDDNIIVLGGVQRFNFLKVVRPGDVLTVEEKTIKAIDNMVIVKVSIKVENTTVAEGQMSFGVVGNE